MTFTDAFARQGVDGGFCAKPGNPANMIARQTPVRAALWFEIDCRLEAAIHVERHRFMFMHDFPLLVDLSEAERVTKPKIVLPSGRVCSLYIRSSCEFGTNSLYDRQQLSAHFIAADNFIQRLED
jgi:hypothetical protein